MIKRMLNDTDQPISSVDDVIAYLFEALRNMRDYPLEDEFQEGYERAFNDVMYHLIAHSTKPMSACSTEPSPTYH
jgi:hypothetical protein